MINRRTFTSKIAGLNLTAVQEHARARVDDLDLIKKAATEAWSQSKPTELEIPISSGGAGGMLATVLRAQR
jgi:hypothetical protein